MSMEAKLHICMLSLLLDTVMVLQNTYSSVLVHISNKMQDVHTAVLLINLQNIKSQMT